MILATVPEFSLEKLIACVCKTTTRLSRVRVRAMPDQFQPFMCQIVAFSPLMRISYHSNENPKNFIEKVNRR